MSETDLSYNGKLPSQKGTDSGTRYKGIKVAFNQKFWIYDSLGDINTYWMMRFLE